MTSDGEYPVPTDVEIMHVVKGIIDSLIHNKISMHIGCPALFIVAADAASFAHDSDEYIISEFRRCLLDARNRNNQHNGTRQ